MNGRKRRLWATSVHRHHPLLALRRDPFLSWSALTLACALAAIWTAVALR